MSPLSLTNLQVTVGGQNVLYSTLSMTYEIFLQQECVLYSTQECVLYSTLNKTYEIFLQQVYLAEQLKSSFRCIYWFNHSRILGSKQMVFCKCRTW